MSIAQKKHEQNFKNGIDNVKVGGGSIEHSTEREKKGEERSGSVPGASA